MNRRPRPVRPVSPRWWRVLRTILQTAGFTAVVAFALWYFAHTLMGRPDEPVTTAWCRRAYDQARGAADSARVDAQRPIVSRTQATVAVTCGTLRTTGELAQ